jgi:hypothetical protein
MEEAIAMTRTFTYQEALDHIATYPSSTDREFADQVALLAQKQVRLEKKAGRPKSIWAEQARTFLRWYKTHRDSLPNN